MRRRILALAAGAALLAPAVVDAAPSPLGPAPAPGTGLPKGQCLKTSEIGNHSVADRSTLLLAGWGKAVYRVTMKGACLGGAVSSDPIAIHNPPGQAVICQPRDLDLRIHGGICIADSIVRLTPDEVAALPRRLRP